MQVAVVGAGIAGMAAARRLAERGVSVTLFESEQRLGGHTATVDVELGGEVHAIDTGFIVLNDRTYPNFMSLLEALGVAIQPTEMSFSVTREQDGLIYNGHDLNSLYARRSNLINPRFQRFVLEIVRFNRLCKRLLHDEKALADASTLGELLKARGFSDLFSRGYIVPMVAAIWSSSENEGLDMPLPMFLRFFNHHGLLDLVNRPQWYTVVGGSGAYIKPLLEHENIDVRSACAVRAVVREADSVRCRVEHDQSLRFDQVLLACHADQALALLEQPSATEQAVLGAMAYRQNDVVLHTDTRLMPPLPRAWASWNYHAGGQLYSPPKLSYYMNRLQRLPAGVPDVMVSLNCANWIDDKKIHGRWQFAHPLFSRESVAAQQRWSEINGAGGVHYAGAGWFNGFHEDGLVSGWRAADAVLATAA